MTSESMSAPVIAFAGVVIAAIISALIAFVTSRKALYVNAVTVERSKWIEKLRGNLARYSAAAHTLFYQAKIEEYTELTEPSAEYYQLLRELQDLRSLIKLQLNPKGEIDQNIICLVDRIYELSRTWTFASELESAERLLVLHAQFLLKAEWEKVKSEARGALRRLISKRYECISAKQYRRFASGEGAIPPFRLTGGLVPPAEKQKRRSTS
jgi:hypothetical protein